MAVNLRPYGLNWTLDPTVKTEFKLPNMDLPLLQWSDENFTITMHDGVIKKFVSREPMIGSGTFGKTFPIVDLQDTSIPKAMKKIKKTSRSSERGLIITEAVIQILIVLESEGLTSGPFCPRIFYIAEDPKSYYIIMEKMQWTLYDFLKSPRSDADYCRPLRQIASILNILNEKLSFNHRDLKSDNIMYNAGSSYKLIDFGLSCITYRGIKISCTSSAVSTCDKVTRDISSLLFNFYLDYLPSYSPIKRIINVLFNSCYPTDMPKKWHNSYAKFNSHPDSPNMHPTVIYNIFRDCSSDSSWTRHLVFIDNVLNRQLNTAEYQHLKKAELVAYLTTDIKNIIEGGHIVDDLNYIGSAATVESDALLHFIMPYRKELFLTQNGRLDLISIIVQNRCLPFFEKFVIHPQLHLTLADSQILHTIAKHQTVLNFMSPILAIRHEPEFINSEDSAGRTPLFYAIKAMNYPAILILLQQPEIELVFSDSTALTKLIGNWPVPSTSVFDAIFDTNSNLDFLSAFNNQALYNSISNNNVYVVSRLLRQVSMCH